jgi:hypothetical protein
MIDAASPRWQGQRGRIEVWYASATDSATGMGLWVHYELVSPTEGDPYVHGWIAGFPSDLPPGVVRFGPEPVIDAGPDWLTGTTFSVGPDRMAGSVGDTSWDLAWRGVEPPLWTMGAMPWRREVLPSCQVVCAPKATLVGDVRIDGVSYSIEAVGNLAHIFGHGNAQKWGWLHADLDDDTTLEIVAAIGRRPAMRKLPPLSFVQLRRDGKDWPRNPLASAALFRARLDLPTWSVRGIIGTHRLSVTVTQPEDRSVYLDYTDPDGAAAVCCNSEIADVDVSLEKWSRGWTTEAQWSLVRTAHAERGYRKKD